MKKFTFLISIISFFLGLAQVQQPLRLELEIDYSNEFNHRVVTLPDTKTALMYCYKRNGEGNDILLKLYDENLKLIREKQVPFTTSEYPLSCLDWYDNTFSLLVYNRKSERYKLTIIDLISFSENKLEGTLMPKLKSLVMDRLDNCLFVRGYRKNILHVFALNGNQPPVRYVIPTLVPKLIISASFSIVKSEFGNEYILLAEAEENRISYHYMIRFDQSGNKIGNTISIPQPEDGKEIEDISISKIKENEFILTGTYGADKRSGSNGIYFAKLEGERFSFFRTYNFLDIENFTNYLSERAKERLDRKKERKESKGEELNIDYRVAVHDIIVHDNEYIFLGEFYYPTYRTETYVTYSNGVPVYRTRRVFDGFQYTHATIASFDQSGTLNWSNCFEMYILEKPYSVKRFIRYELQNKQTQLLFLTRNKIQSITFERNKIVNEKSVDIIKPEDEADEVKATYSSNLYYWYTNTFLGYGIQKIKNLEKERGERRREVFFINKISY